MKNSILLKFFAILSILCVSLAICACNTDHTHSYVNGKCECGEADPDYVAHEHVYVEGKCECGAEDPDYVAHEHVYVEGKCECGAEDPD